MSLFSIIQNTADVIGIKRPAYVFGNSDSGARTLLAMANQLGRNLAKMRSSGDGGWAELNKAHIIVTLPGETRYPLPDDYYGLIKRTAWSVNEYAELDDPLSQADWAYHQNAIGRLSIYPRFRIAADASGKYIDISPVPGGGDTISFGYISKNWVLGPEADGTRPARDKFATDVDDPVFDENLMELGLIATYVQRRGLPFAYELAAFEEMRSMLLANSTGLRDIPLGYDRRHGWGRGRYGVLGTPTVRIAAGS